MSQPINPASDSGRTLPTKPISDELSTKKSGHEGLNLDQQEASSLGNIQTLIQELASLGAPYEYQLIIAAVLGMEGIGAVSGALSTFISSFINMVDDPTSANCEAFYDAYQTIYDWTKTTSSNPAVVKIDQLGAKLGWSSSQEQQYIGEVTGKATDLLNSIDNILDTTLDPFLPPGDSPLSWYLQYPGYGNVHTVFDALADSLNKAISDPQEYPSEFEAFESALDQLSTLLGQVTSTLSAMVVPQVKLAAGELSSLIGLFASMIKMEAKQYQSQESNMPGYGGG
jgi:hypothetical protein